VREHPSTKLDVHKVETQKKKPRKELAEKITERLMLTQGNIRKREKTESADKQLLVNKLMATTTRDMDVCAKVTRNKSEFGLRSSRLPDIGSVKGLKELKLRKIGITTSKPNFTQRVHV